MKNLLLILLCLPLIGFSQWQLPAAFTAQADPVNIMPISFTTDTTAVMSNPSGGDTLIIDNWEWDFGDGTTDTIQNPIHSYVTYGNYTVCLTAGGYPTNGNLIYYTFINCDTFTYSPSGWAKMGQGTTADWWCIGGVTGFLCVQSAAQPNGTLVSGPYNDSLVCSTNCIGTNIFDHENTSNRKQIKVINVLGEEIDNKRNTLLFYIYDDGTVEKKIIIE